MIRPAFRWRICCWAWARPRKWSRPASAGGDLKCPHCGFTQADFKKAGRLGCAECYTTFAEGLEGLLNDAQRHQARRQGPASSQAKPGFGRQIEDLQKKLEKAIAEEDFEAAVHLRDEINQRQSQTQRAD